MSNMMIIEMQLLNSRLKEFTGDLKEKLLFAMKQSRQGISGLAILSDDEKFRVAIAAVIMSSDGEEKERLEWEMKCLRALSTMFGGIPVDIASVSEEGTSRGWEPVGLLLLWKDTEEGA